MLASYVVADLVRNPRRTLSTMVGVTLGVGLFCGVLFFVDGLSASMTQRAVAPLPIDMQRIVTGRTGVDLVLTQSFNPGGTVTTGDRAQVQLELHNNGSVPANEVTVRSAPGGALRYVNESAEIDGVVVAGYDDNPFDHGAGRTGFNLGTVQPGESRQIVYLVEAQAPGMLDDTTITSAYSSRESVNLVPANEPAEVALDQLARDIAAVDGVARAGQLSFVDLGSGTLSSSGVAATGPVKVFGFDAEYGGRDETIRIVDGELGSRGAVLSAEAADGMGAGLADPLAVALPDGSTLDLEITGIADLSEARSLFASRRGGDLEAFVYTRNSIVVSPTVFDQAVLPAFQRAVTARGGRLKSPPVREVDVVLDRAPLDADPASAAVQTQRIGEEVSAVAAHQDFLLDNITNTLDVAAADAEVAKRLFVFLGVPGGILAAMLAAYAGTILADAQRREQATLRIRGASRRHLLRMLALRTGLLTAAGAIVGLAIGYGAASLILGQESLSRAATSSLVTSAILGTVGGFVATGSALYLTGRRSIDREIDEDRARLAARAPLWRRAGLDVVGVAVVAIGTVIAVRTRAFDGAPGSVYFGRSVELNLALLVLPVAVWITGSLLAARVFGTALTRSQPRSTSALGRPLPSLYRLSVTRRPWAIGNGAVIISLIVALAVSLASFTASYDAAKAEDARFANGSDIRITPSPTSPRTYEAVDAARFRTESIGDATPVVYGVHNVILRSERTSDPANLAAIEPASFASVTPLADTHFPSGDAAGTLQMLASDPTAVLVSEDMAKFLQAAPGDSLNVLLARATDDQTEVELHIAGVFERLPGFPDGVDAVMSIDAHTAAVPAKGPDFFLAAAAGSGDVGLERALASLEEGAGATDGLQFDTRLTTLARDQSSLAALNIAGLVDLDSASALAMAVVAIAIFVFGLLLQRRREYVTLRAQGLEPGTIRLLIAAEAGTVAAGGAIAGLLVGAAMGYYFVTVLRPLFVLVPSYSVPLGAVLMPVVLVFAATLVSAVVGSRMVNRLEPTELLRDE